MEPNGSDEAVRVGAMLFTLVDPSPGHEVAYNRWYERDHFYSGCMVGPWLFSGRRWVSTRPLKDLRFPADTPDDVAVARPVDAGSYLATYFIHSGHEAEHFAWANKQVFELYANGRGFDERHHAHTSLYFHVGGHRGDHGDGVPAHMALDHPYGGLVSLHLDRENDVRHEQYAEWFDEVAAPTLLSDGRGGGGPVDLVVDWRPIIPKGSEGDAPMDLGTGPGTRQRSLQMLFCRNEPTADWEAFHELADRIDESGLATVRLVAPFIPTIPGADTYTDQLW